MLDRIVLHGEFSLFTVRGNFWYQIYRNRSKKILCSRLALITLTTNEHNSLGSSGNGNPGKFIGRELSPKVKEIEPSGFQQNVRLEILKLAPQEQNLGQPRF